MSWGKLRGEAPNLADYGEARFASGVAYLATVRKDGSPRMHPVTPILGDDNDRQHVANLEPFATKNLVG